MGCCHPKICLQRRSKTRTQANKNSSYRCSDNRRRKKKKQATTSTHKHHVLHFFVCLFCFFVPLLTCFSLFFFLFTLFYLFSFFLFCFLVPLLRVCTSFSLFFRGFFFLFLFFRGPTYKVERCTSGAHWRRKIEREDGQQAHGQRTAHSAPLSPVSWRCRAAWTLICWRPATCSTAGWPLLPRGRGCST